MTVTQRTYIPFYMSVIIRKPGSGRDSIRLDNLQKKFDEKLASPEGNSRKCMENLKENHDLDNIFLRVVIRVFW